MIETIQDPEVQTPEGTRTCGWVGCGKEVYEKIEFVLDPENETFFVCHVCKFHYDVMHQQYNKGHMWFLIDAAESGKLQGTWYRKVS